MDYNIQVYIFLYTHTNHMYICIVVKFICRVCGMHLHVSRDVRVLYSACAACACSRVCIKSKNMAISWTRRNKTGKQNI